MNHMTAPTLLKVTGLKVAYGGIQAVKGVSFEVHQGELVSLIGANGAGKTTTLKAITGIQPIAQGSVEKLSAKATVSDWSLNSWPAMPVMKIIGAKTATDVRVAANTAVATSAVPRRAASTRVMPFS